MTRGIEGPPLFVRAEEERQERTALLFGANGVVGNQVLKAIVQNSYWRKVILVGRRFPPLSSLVAGGGDGKVAVNDEQQLQGRSISAAEQPEIVQIQLSDLINIHEKREELFGGDGQGETIDACFIAIGVGKPYLYDLKYWYSVEVEMVSSISKLCNEINGSGHGVKYIGVLSAIDAEEDPKPFSVEELNIEGADYNDNPGNPLGWWGMLKNYSRLKGLEEVAVVEASKHASFVRFYQPSTIVTEESRYGCVDRIIFAFHRVFDPIIPKRYHSIDVKLLGRVIALDAVQILSGVSVGEEGRKTNDKVTKLTYRDYLDIMIENAESSKKVEMKNEEL